jgi:hypothetical protein
MRRLVLAFLFIQLLVTSLAAVTLHVPEQYNTISEAILNAEVKDTVLVEPGEYSENIDFLGMDIILASHFILDSSYEIIPATIISNPARAGSDSGTVVMFQGGETSKAHLIGFTIQDGFGTLIADNFVGGGIMCRNNSHPTIRHNIIRDNNAVDGGGCAFIDSDPLFCHNLVIHNNAITGGGIYMDNSMAVIDRCVFAFNDASGQGGALYLLLSDGSVLKNSVLYQNSAGSIGGIACFFAFPEIGFNCFFENTGGNYGDCLAGLGEISGYNFNGEPADIYSNIFCNPGFINPAGDDFRILPNSPLIDAGKEFNPDFPVNGIKVDIGLFELSYYVSDCNSDDKFNISDAVFLLNWIFADGSVPVPIYACDYDCDRLANVSDVVSMLNRIFLNGKGPCEGMY